MMTIYGLLEISLLFLIYALLSPALAAEQECSIPPKPLFIRLANCTIPPNSDYPDGVDSWGIRVALASPQQDMCLAPSLVVYSLNNSCCSEQKRLMGARSIIQLSWQRKFVPATTAVHCLNALVAAAASSTKRRPLPNSLSLRREI